MGAFLLSGATGLIYELVWTRQLIFVFGGTTYAITTVLVAFMGGLGLGCYLAGRLCHRVWPQARANNRWSHGDEARRWGPAGVYGALEICIGLYALAVPELLGAMEPVYRAMYDHVADQPWLLTAVRVLISAGVLLIPTTCMGATLPLLVHYLAASGGGIGSHVGRLYGINTFGAAMGTLATGFLLLPALGLSTTTRLAAAANVLIGLAAILLLRSKHEPHPEVSRGGAEDAEKVNRGESAIRNSQSAVPFMDRANALRRRVLIASAVSGFCAMVYQISWTRVLVMSIGSSTYAFTCILAAFILGLALGSLALAGRSDRWNRPATTLGILQLGVGLSSVLIAPHYGRVPSLVQHLVWAHADRYGVVLALEFLLVIGVTVVPTFLMGATFPLVTRAAAVADHAAALNTGRAYAANTAGTILGAFLAGFVLIRGDVLGVQNSIVAAALLNAAVGAWLVVRGDLAASSRPRPLLWPIAAVLAVPLLGAASGGWSREWLTSAPFMNLASSPDAQPVHRVEFFAEGVDVTAAVTVWPGDPEILSLSINGKADASTEIPDMTTQLLTGHLSALLTGDGQRACVIGLGSGMTTAAFPRYPTYTAIDCVELSEEVVRAAEYFAPFTYEVLHDPRVRLIRADGRNHLLLSDRTYDVITSEPSNPWMAGIANLFTVEFYRLCRSRLAEDGLLLTWLHAYQMSQRDFRMVARTLCEVFESVSVWELSQSADYLFVASRRRPAIPLDDVLARYRTPSVRSDLYRVGVARIEQVLGRFIAGDSELRAWAAAAPVNTDDNARLEFSAPRNIYRSEQMQIATELFALQQSVFDRWLVADPQRPDHQTIVRRTLDVVRSRTARVQSYRRWEAGDVAGSLEDIFEAYALNPGDFDIFRRLVELCELARARQGDAGRPDARIAALIARMDTLRRPILARNTGASLEEIAASLVSFSENARHSGKLEVAADYLAEAHGLLPDHADILMTLADVLAAQARFDAAAAVLDPWLAARPNDAQAALRRARVSARQGDPETAIAHLRIALAGGAITPDGVRQDDAFAGWMDDPRLTELLGGAAGSGPR